MAVDVILLAGTSARCSLARSEGVVNKALVEIGAYPMFFYSLKAALGASSVRNVVLVGPAAELKKALEGPMKPCESERLTVLNEDEDIIGNIRRGLSALSAAEAQAFVVMSTDIPLITGEIVDEFVTRALAADRDFVYPIIDEKTVKRAFPASERTFVATADGRFTGGNVFFLRKKALEPCLGLGHRFLAARKRPLRLAMMLGPLMILKFLLKRIRILDVERRFRGLTGCSGTALLVDRAEIGVDADKPGDLELMRRHLADTG